MSHTIKRPPAKEWHPCHPGEHWFEQRPYDPTTMAVPDPPTGWYCSPSTNEPAGTIAQCNICGQVWVVEHVPKTYYGRRGHGSVWMAHNVWREETPRERRKREGRRRYLLRKSGYSSGDTSAALLPAPLDPGPSGTGDAW